MLIQRYRHRKEAVRAKATIGRPMEIMLVEHGRQNQERPQKNVALSDHFFRVLGRKEHLRFVDFWFRIKGSRKEKYEPIRIFYDDERTANLVITRYHWHYFLVWTGVFQGWDNATRSARRIGVTCDEVFNTPYVQGVRLDMPSRPLPRLAWNAGAIFDYITLATERALLRDSYETAGKALVDQMKKDIDGAITGRKFLEIVERCIQQLLSLNEEFGPAVLKLRLLQLPSWKLGPKKACIQKHRYLQSVQDLRSLPNL